MKGWAMKGGASVKAVSKEKCADAVASRSSPRRAVRRVRLPAAALPLGARIVASSQQARRQGKRC
eukprot:4636228-Alexandrium_andersonii.AAC.1